MRHAAFVIALLLVAGCDSFGDVAAVDAEAGTPVSSAAELAAAQAAWDAGGPASYRLVYTVSCEGCVGGDRVTVRDRSVVGTERLTAGEALTVDDLFRIARDAFAEGYSGEVRLSNTAPRFPTLVGAIRDRVPGEPLTSGVGILVTVTGFEAD